MLLDYTKAKKEGERAYRKAVLSGRYPYLPALEQMVEGVDKLSEYKVGLKEIPLNMIVGTRTVGRQNAFADNFMPLLGEGTEFAIKWSNLFDSQAEEGLRDPIKVYEFMNKFYVLEGNKRVSVMKSIDAASILGNVIRLMPMRSEERAVKVYYEFLEFYKVTELYGITFSQEGSYKKLAAYLGQDLEHPWPENVIENLRASFIIFNKAFENRSGQKLAITPGDALLTYVGVFGFEGLMVDSTREIENRISRLWNEYLMQMSEEKMEVVENLSDVEKAKPKAMKSILSLGSGAAGSVENPVRVAFIYDKYAKDSSWIYGHELGRNELERRFGGTVDAIAFEGCDTQEKVDAAFEAAAADKETLVFAASPALMEASMRAALKYPRMRIMNCSVNLLHSAVPSYYAHMYEAKFMMGALAASLAENHVIGYRADYPIYGGIANINAFALGAQLFDPYCKVKLVWATKKGTDWEKELSDAGCSIISGIDMIKPGEPSRKYGLYRVKEDGSVQNLAAPIYQWGRFYELLIRKHEDGSLGAIASAAKNRAVNIWWGMSAGVVDVIFSDDLPFASRKTMEALRRVIGSQTLDPFEGEIHSQSGVIREPGSPRMTNREIIAMDWLCENVIGEIPDMSELEDSVKGRVVDSAVKEMTAHK